MITVVAGICLRGNEILLGRRRDDETQFNGYWEFPGGKLEVGESEIEALRREFKEELKAQISNPEFFQEVIWEYPHRVLKLRFYLCEIEDLNADSDWEAHSEIRWISVEEACRLSLLPANLGILEALKSRCEDRSER